MMSTNSPRQGCSQYNAIREDWVERCKREARLAEGWHNLSSCALSVIAAGLGEHVDLTLASSYDELLLRISGPLYPTGPSGRDTPTLAESSRQSNIAREEELTKS